MSTPINRVARIRVKHSWQCLDAVGVSYEPGTHFQQWPCHGGENQQFLIESLGNGFHRIRVKHTRQCLDTVGVSYDPGAHFQQWPCHGGDNQQFLIE